MKKNLIILLLLLTTAIFVFSADFSSGVKLFHSKKYAEAEAVFRELKEMDSEKFDYKYYLALSLIFQDDSGKFTKGIRIILNNWGMKEPGFWDQQYDKYFREPFGRTLERSAIVFCEGLKRNNSHVIRYALEFQTYFSEILYDNDWGQFRDRCTNLHNYLTIEQGLNLDNYKVGTDTKTDEKIYNKIKFGKYVIDINSESLDYPLRIAGLNNKDKDLFMLSELQYQPLVGKLYKHVYGEPKLKTVENKAFGTGEYIIYQINYGVIKAGYSTMTIPETIDLRGYKVFHCVSEAKTTKFFDITYSVRNTYESFFDTRTFASLKYIEDSNEGNKTRYRTTYYNVDELTAKYEEKEFGIAPGVMDVLTALYYVRTQKLYPGRKIQVDTTSGTHNYRLVVEVHEGEKLKTKIGKVDTILVIPRLKHESGIFKAKGELKIWMTTDDKHIPVKMSSKVIVGSFEVNIIDYSDSGVPKTYERLFK